jgi:hypothetical protein
VRAAKELACQVCGIAVRQAQGKVKEVEKDVRFKDRWQRQVWCGCLCLCLCVCVEGVCMCVCVCVCVREREREYHVASVREGERCAHTHTDTRCAHTHLAGIHTAAWVHRHTHTYTHTHKTNTQRFINILVCMSSR